MSLDEYVSENQIRQIDLVKIDVEGAELEVLSGGRYALGEALRPKLVSSFLKQISSDSGRPARS